MQALLGLLRMEFRSPIIIGEGRALLLLSIVATALLLVTAVVLVRRAQQQDFQWSDWVCVAFFVAGVTFGGVTIPLPFIALVAFLPFRNRETGVDPA